MTTPNLAELEAAEQKMLATGQRFPLPAIADDDDEDDDRE